jgi:hypothetical protein
MSSPKLRIEWRTTPAPPAGRGLVQLADTVESIWLIAEGAPPVQLTLAQAEVLENGLLESLPRAES